MLDRFRVLASDSCEEDFAALRRIHPNVRRIEPLERGPYHVTLNAFLFGNSAESTVIESFVTTGTLIEIGPLGDLDILIPMTNSAQAECGREARQLPPGGMAGLMPASEIRARLTVGQDLVLRASKRRVSSVMRQLECEAAIDPILDEYFFESKISGMDRLAKYVRQVVWSLDSEPQNIIDLPAFRAATDQLILLRIAQVLTSAVGPDRPIRVEHCGAALRRAVDYVRDHADGFIEMAAMAHYSGVSLRSLQLMFRRAFDCTITQFIQRQRLEAARQRLERARSGQTVAEIAESSGFNHMGFFGRAYRDAFGELPSETLRRVRTFHNR